MNQMLDRVKLDAPEFCDRCNARAAVIARKLDLQLAFCGHHSHSNAERLKAAGFELLRIED